jgi:hypothetical protein
MAYSSYMNLLIAWEKLAETQFSHDHPFPVFYIIPFLVSRLEQCDFTLVLDIAD